MRIVGNSPCSIAPVQHRYADKMIDLLGAKDYLIAAHALSLVFTVVTDNVGEFSRVPQLIVENWLIP